RPPIGSTRLPYTTLFRSDLDGDGRAEIITVGGPGGGPHARAFRVEGGATRLLEGEAIRLHDRPRPVPDPDRRLGSSIRTDGRPRSEEHTSELQSLAYLVC